MTRRRAEALAEPIALTVRDAAAAIGISETTLRALRDRGDIEFRYLSAHPTVLVADLKALVEKAPTERVAS